ncbi:L10-INTERACTING MYB DOMAIN-CONTAINING PROTEIN-LIKE ISOFORM X1 [Salix koriyanagi]|uniref:L10-INTERACTING MYB DOMAIN-CONTAINING PROTEIN-LIKE ISOFORM X1 n=1 Tax=Salix koriyanagi TaxID=2511006 RepID=A0A9Q0V026_9ROSI|nr:L10-INTERACTING MYB DOMAIN-CONTAINING PROTEIN-LIKE ISOFORM X1 [Salix koriyanagi]
MKVGKWWWLMIKFGTATLQLNVKPDPFAERAFHCTNRCPSYLKVNFIFLLSVYFEGLMHIVMCDIGERVAGKFQLPNGAPVETEEGNSNTETVQSSERANLPAQLVDGALDSYSTVRVHDRQLKKRKSIGPSASGHKKRACENIGETLENALYEMFSAFTFKAMQRNASNEKAVYQKCLEQLQKLDEFDDTEFVKAVNALRDDKNAIAFMAIKGPRRLMWLRSLWQ